ncbi:MAG: hypothetical protein ACOC05_06190, partial [Oceanicaulis sp.]
DDRRYETGGYDEGYGRGGDYGYDGGYGRSSGELLGGPDAGRYETRRESQVYTAGSAAAPATGACRDMRSAGRLVHMCQGSDGLWRPAETYR